ncbi:MAG: lysine biosynthesis enzyme LysX, partial [Desulfurococcales archaeon]|nr:lysine biosynthesis enzyme LysX [Desulfurococcales archaeon]
TGEEAIELAARAAEAVGGGLVSIDLLESQRGLLVNEVNGVPEFRGLTATIGRGILEGIARGITRACRR